MATITSSMALSLCIFHILRMVDLNALLLVDSLHYGVGGYLLQQEVKILSDCLSISSCLNNSVIIAIIAVGYHLKLFLFESYASICQFAIHAFFKMPPSLN